MQKTKNADWALEGDRLFFDHNPQPMFVIDRDDLRFLDANAAALSLYGYGLEELLLMQLPDLWPKDDRQSYLEMMAGQPEDRIHQVGLRRHLKKDGSEIMVDITRQSLTLEGRPAILAAVQDLTEYHSAREALKEKDDMFRLMIEGVEDYGIIMLDGGGRILSWNEGAERNTGFTENEVVGRHWSCFYTSDDIREGRPDAALILAESQGRCEEEGWRPRKDGSRYYADSVLSALRDSFGRLRGYACISRDVTERRLLEQQMLEVAEREQERIGQDLHDSLGQRLTGMGLLAKALEDRLSGKDKTAAKEARVLREKLVETTEQARRLARGLYSPDLEAGRLLPALRQLLEDAKVLFRIETVFEGDEAAAVDKSVATQLYHIAQEALHNAVRHGKAKRVAISLKQAAGGAVLTVRDDGVGLPKTLPKSRGMGLRIMKYRAGLIGAELAVSNQAGGGVQVRCRAGEPLKNANLGNHHDKGKRRRK